MKRITEDIQKLADKYGFELDLSQKIYEMSVSQKQTVEIIKDALPWREDSDPG